MILSFENVCAGYGKRQVLQDLNFQIRPHKMTAVLGKDGRDVYKRQDAEHCCHRQKAK